MEHAPLFVAAAVAVAIAASGLALFLAGGRSGRPPLILSATALGFAISGMHYTAMAGVTIMPHAVVQVSAPVLSTDLLAIVVAVVAFGVSGIFLLTLVPDRGANAAADAASTGSAAMAAAAMPSPESPALPAAAAEDHPLSMALARVDPPPEQEKVEESLAEPVRLLPIVREGATHFVSVRDIVAVHANAHYTTLFDGTAKHFCPLPISEVEARLDHAHFVRVHRSHIVNLERVVGLRRNGDHGLIELAGHDPYTVPVSRSRFGGVKTQLGLGPRMAVG
jgi:DNA-binding LytR/AlgR family response regulator